MADQIANRATVQLQIEQDIAVICIDNPPVNSGNLQVRQGILAALKGIDYARIRAVVLTGHGRNLMAGADLREMDSPPLSPGLPEVTAALEASPVPVVALIKGYTLGGGLELALACDYRLAYPDAMLGFPEVTVGVIPGAGGTQRLPRLVGLSHAVEMIASGSPVPSEKALEMGMIDGIFPVNDISEQYDFIQEFLTAVDFRKHKISEKKITDDASFQSTVEKYTRRSRNQPSVLAALNVLVTTRSLDFDSGLEKERAAFLELRSSTSAKAMRYLFFAERNATPATLKHQSQPISKVAVIGAGTMGSGIAYCALAAGYPVSLVDSKPDMLVSARQRIKTDLQRDVGAGRFDSTRSDQILDNLTLHEDIRQITSADLVVEAIVEDLAAKQQLFGTLSQIMSDKTLLATNTSYLDINAIAQHVENPQRVLGLHFFSPASRMPLLEIVHTRDTDQSVLAAGLNFARKLNKKAIVVRNAFGFVGNRIFAAYRRQCEFILEEGAYPDQIDRALEDYGFAMGPFKVADMSGLDIAWSMRRQQMSTRHLSRYVGIPDLLCEANRLGRKTGKGYYSYTTENKPVRDPDVIYLIDDYRSAHHIVPRGFSDREIQRRVEAALINEALLLLEEGICARPEDIDIALVNGYGFPRWRGGPVFIARQMQRDQLEKVLDELAEVSGKGHRRGDSEILSQAELIAD